MTAESHGRDSRRHPFFLDIEPWVMMGPDDASLLVPRAHIEEEPGALQGEVREVLAAHHRRDVDHVVLADRLAGRFANDRVHARVVDDARIAPQVVNLHRGPHGRRRSRWRSRSERRSSDVPDLVLEGAHGAAQFGRVRDDVERLARQECGDRNDAGLNRDRSFARPAFAATSRSATPMTTGSIAALRAGGMTALALDPNRELVAGCGARSVPSPIWPIWHFGGDMKPEHRINVRVFERPFANHGDRAARRQLFRRLEQHLDRSGKLVAPIHEQPASGPAASTVWASWPQACITPGFCRDVLRLDLFEDRQGIHIGPDEDHAILARAIASSPDQPRDAGSADPGANVLHTEGYKPLVYKLRGGSIPGIPIPDTRVNVADRR